MLRRPSLGLAEIAWRWSLSFAAVLLLFFSFVEYLDTLPVTEADLLLLRSRIVVPADAHEDVLRERAQADEKIRAAIAGKQVVKVIVVPSKLVNIVIR